MDADYPHEVRRFADGEPIPSTFIPLTEFQFQTLDSMSPDQRAEYLKDNAHLFGGPSPDILSRNAAQRVRDAINRDRRRNQSSR